MATTIIPLVAPFIPDIIMLVEKLIGVGNGQKKADLANQLGQTIVNTVSPAQTSSTPPSTDWKTALAGAIEMVVQDLNAQNKLNGANTTSGPAPQQVPAPNEQPIGILYPYTPKGA